MVNTLYLPELREMLAEGNADELREFCSSLHPARTAEFMEGLDASEIWRVLELADPDPVVGRAAVGVAHVDKRRIPLSFQTQSDLGCIVLVLERHDLDRVPVLQGERKG